MVHLSRGHAQKIQEPHALQKHVEVQGHFLNIALKVQEPHALQKHFVHVVQHIEGPRFDNDGPPVSVIGGRFASEVFLEVVNKFGKEAVARVLEQEGDATAKGSKNGKKSEDYSRGRRGE